MDNMRCSCGSYAVNIDKSGGKCDVCYYRDTIEVMSELIQVQDYDEALKEAADALSRLR